MLQIIGWLGCVYLIFRALQMRFSREFEDDHGRFRDGANYLMLTAILIGLVFAIWLLFQGTEFQTRPDLAELNRRADEAERVAECMERASPDYVAMMACQ